MKLAMKKFFSLKVNDIFAIVLLLFIFGMSIKLGLNYIREGEIVVPFRTKFYDIYGYCNEVLSPLEIDHDADVAVKLEDGNIAYGNKTETKVNCPRFEKNITKLSDVCKKAGIDFLYVNFPTKPKTDSEITSTGLSCNKNAVATEFMSDLKEQGVNTLDIKEVFEEENLDFYSLYFKTDHHWKISTGLMAAREIAKELNQQYGYDLDLDNLDDDNFVRENLPNAWIGEIGRDNTRTWSHAEDFEYLYPNYETDFTYSVPEIKQEYKGAFEDSLMFSYKLESAGNNFYYAPSLYYTYLDSNYGFATIHNEKIKNGKTVLISKDSYSLSVIPFLALDFENIIIWDPRYNDNNIYDYVKDNSDKIDLVLVEYSSSMIGNPEMSFN